MDYFGILKRAWQVTWKYKVLWVLGFFALSGGSSGGSGGGSGYRYDTSSGFGTSQYAASFERLRDWVVENTPVLIVVAAFLGLLSIVYFVLSIAARGGLVHSVNEAEQGRPVSLSEGWSVGFRHWGRTFMVGLVTMLPIAVVAVVVAGVLAVAGVAVLAGSGVFTGLDQMRYLPASGDWGSLVAAGGAFLCCGLPLLGILFVALAVVLGIVMELGIRYGVLYDMTFGKAITQGWRDVRAKRGSVVMWLVMLLPGLAYGVIVGILALIAIVPAVLALREGGSLTPIFVAAGVLIVLLLVPNAIYGTFVSASWTIFFRRMTGLEPPAAVPAAPYGAPGSYPAPVAYAPPAPPIAYAPPQPSAPPAAYVPPQPQPSAPPAIAPEVVTPGPPASPEPGDAPASQATPSADA